MNQKKHALLPLILFVFVLASCATPDGVKIAEEDFDRDCGGEECIQSQTTRDNFIPEKYLTKSAEEEVVQEKAEKKVFVPVKSKEIDEILKPAKSSDALFEFNKYSLTEVGRDILDNIAKLMKKNPSYKLHLSGHTDNKGTMAYNTELSKKRVESGKNYLVEKGIEADRISISWHSFSQPKASNDTPEGRALNRRIEFKFIED